MDTRSRVIRFLNADRVAALVFLVVIALYGWYGSQFTAALQVDVVGPAFFPKILTFAGAFLAVLLFVRSPAEPAGNEDTEPAGSHLTALAPLLLLFAYVLLFEPLGFPLATTAFLAVTFRYLGYPAWKGALLLAAAISISIFCVFYFVLDLKLPLGAIARLI